MDSKEQQIAEQRKAALKQALDLGITPDEFNIAYEAHIKSRQPQTLPQSEPAPPQVPEISPTSPEYWKDRVIGIKVEGKMRDVWIGDKQIYKHTYPVPFDSYNENIDPGDRSEFGNELLSLLYHRARERDDLKNMHYVLFDKLKDGKIVLFYGGYQDEKAQDGRAGYTPVSVHFAINNQTYDELIKEIRRGNWDVLPTFFEANAPNLMENPTQNRTGLRFVRSRNVAYVNHTSPQFDEWLNTEGRISKRYINAPYSGQAEVLSLMDNGFKNGVIVKGEYSKPFGAGIPYQPGS